MNSPRLEDEGRSHSKSHRSFCVLAAKAMVAKCRVFSAQIRTVAQKTVELILKLRFTGVL